VPQVHERLKRRPTLLQHTSHLPGNHAARRLRRLRRLVVRTLHWRPLWSAVSHFLHY